MNTFEELFEYISTLEIVDTHEYLPHCESAREQCTDIMIRIFELDIDTG